MDCGGWSGMKKTQTFVQSVELKRQPIKVIGFRQLKGMNIEQEIFYEKKGKGKLVQKVNTVNALALVSMCTW